MEKNKTLGLLYYLRNDKLNKDGLAPIYLRITVDGKRAAVSLNRHIDPDRWNTEGGKAKGTKEDIRELNNYLDSVKATIHSHQRNLLDRSKAITADTLRNAFLGVKDNKQTLLELFAFHNQEMREGVGKGFAEATLTRYETTLEHIKDFLKKKYRRTDMQLNELNYKFITDLEHYFKTTRECNHNSTLKYIRNFRKIVNIAVANDWLDKDPFIKYKSKLQDTARTYLTAEELKSIEDKEITIERIGEVRDIFVFCCYTGLAYADVAKLTTDDIRNGIDGNKWIFTYRTKTETKSNLPLLPVPLAIIKKYKEHPECARTGKLLPVKSNQKLNVYLKELADICDIKKVLTSHMARHTFSTTVTLTNGVPIETLSKMLGHKSIRTTQIYGKIIEKKVSDDMADLQKRLVRKVNRKKNVV